MATIDERKVEEIGHYDGDFSIKLEESLINLYNVTSYNDLITKLNVKMPNAPRGSDDYLKKLKSEISDNIKEIKKLAIYESEEEIIKSIKSTYPTIEIIIK